MRNTGMAPVGGAMPISDYPWEGDILIVIDNDDPEVIERLSTGQPAIMKQRGYRFERRRLADGLDWWVRTN